MGINDCAVQIGLHGAEIIASVDAWVVAPIQDIVAEIFLPWMGRGAAKFIGNAETLDGSTDASADGILRINTPLTGTVPVDAVCARRGFQSKTKLVKAAAVYADTKLDLRREKRGQAVNGAADGHAAIEGNRKEPGNGSLVPIVPAGGHKNTVCLLLKAKGIEFPDRKLQVRNMKRRASGDRRLSIS